MPAKFGRRPFLRSYPAHGMTETERSHTHAVGNKRTEVLIGTPENNLLTALAKTHIFYQGVRAWVFLACSCSKNCSNSLKLYHYTPKLKKITEIFRPATVDTQVYPEIVSSAFHLTEAESAFYQQQKLITSRGSSLAHAYTCLVDVRYRVHELSCSQTERMTE